MSNEKPQQPKQSACNQYESHLNRFLQESCYTGQGNGGGNFMVYRSDSKLSNCEYKDIKRKFLRDLCDLEKQDKVRY
jgi:hypothetical protein